MNSTFDKLSVAIRNAINNPTWMKSFDEEYANKVEIGIKKTAPVKTGALRDSISVEPIREGINIRMLEYGIYVDQGTKTISPRYFIKKGMSVGFAELIKNSIIYNFNKELE